MRQVAMSVEQVENRVKDPERQFQLGTLTCLQPWAIGRQVTSVALWHVESVLLPPDPRHHVPA